MRRLAALVCILGTLAALLSPGTALARDKAKAETARRALIATAIADPRRLPGDSDQDAWRRPQAVLEFAGILPAMKAIDYLAGGGLALVAMDQHNAGRGDVERQPEQCSEQQD